MTRQVKRIPATRMNPSWRPRCSINLIVVLESPRVLPMSMRRLWAPFKVILCDLRPSKIPEPCCRRLSMPLEAFLSPLLCWTLGSIIISTWSLVVNLWASSASLSSSSRILLILWLRQEFRAADKWRQSYFSWSTRIFAFWRCDTGPFRHSMSSRSQLLHRRSNNKYIIAQNYIYNKVA